MAYEAHLKGLFFVNQMSHEGMTKAKDYFLQAIELDPAYAPAYAGLADVNNREAIRGYIPAKEAYPAAKEAVSKALQIDDASSEAHTLLGVIRFRFDWDWGGAERELKRALELNPGSSRARLAFSTYLLAMGRVEESIGEAQRALQSDPLTGQRYVDLAWKLSYGSRHDDAIHRLDKALELAPDFAPAYVQLARNHAAKGMHSEAIAACEKAFGLRPDSISLVDCARVNTLAGRRHEARKLLGNLLAQRYVSPYQLALLYDALDRTTRALVLLVQAYEERAPEMCFLRTSSFSEKLRSEPRFQELLRRLNFPH